MESSHAIIGGAESGRAPGFVARQNVFSKTCIVLLVLAGRLWAGEPPLESSVSGWLHSQALVRTWSAQFTQTRTLKSLTEPLKAAGRVWFAAPNRFRWELGEPARTIAIRTPDELLVIYPRLKRAERFPLKRDSRNPWGEALALLEAGFPRSESELLGQYRVLKQNTSTDRCELVLEPRSAGARKMMPEIRIAFGIADRHLWTTELVFADGSTMRNDFTGQVLNPEIAPDTFAAEIPADFTQVEPMAESKRTRGR